MMEVFQESLRWANLPFTILLGAVLAYWTLVGIGFLHFDSGGGIGGDGHHIGGGEHAELSHVHADGHAEAHSDVGGHDGDGAHAESDADSEADAVHPGLLGHVLHFVNVGEVPLM